MILCREQTIVSIFRSTNLTYFYWYQTKRVDLRLFNLSKHKIMFSIDIKGSLNRHLHHCFDFLSLMCSVAILLSTLRPSDERIRELSLRLSPFLSFLINLSFSNCWRPHLMILVEA